MTTSRLSPTPFIDPSAQVSGCRLGAWTEIGPRCLVSDSTMGDYAYAINDCEIAYARIGNFCSLASHVRVNPGNHPLARAALHHFTYRSEQFDMGSDDRDFFNWRKTHAVTLGHDVWIGHGAVILPGVTIGTGAAIGAGAVVSKDVPEFAVAAGVPAKVLRRRFPAGIREALLRIQWWHWPHDTLRRRIHDFRTLDIETFVAKYDETVKNHWRRPKQGER